MRYFNTSGPNIIEQHYTLQRLDLIEAGKKMVYENRYFTIWAPRQTGKSTYFQLLATALEQDGYKVAYINFENYKAGDLSSFLYEFHAQLKVFWGVNFEDSDLQNTFSRITEIKDQKLVLIIDEVEGINPEYFGDFLHSIRSAYHSRTKHGLKSVILVGVSNIVGVVEDNASPFNIADNLNVPYFTDQETLDLLAQHETETGQLFDPSVKAKISEITANQPGLVNGFAWKLVDNHPNKPVIDYSDYLIVERWYLTQSLDKNVSNIINKAKKHREFIERLLFTDVKIPFQIYRDHIKELYVNGVITYDKDNFITFHVPLYRKCLHAAFYPYLNGESDRIQGNIEVKAYFNDDNILNLDKVIQEYKAYTQRRGFQFFREQDENGNYISIPEAALVYSFETFINAFLGVVGGHSYLEAHVALGRTDILINVRGHEQVVEAKVYKNITQFNDGKAQLAYYLNHLGLKKGYYLVFVNTDVTHSEVIEGDEPIEGVQIKTYLVRYELDKDFTLPRKNKVVKKKK
jgi:hypothetical protein